MCVAQLRNDLIKLVVTVEDKDFLQQMIALFRSHEKGEDWWDELSKEELELIKIGMAELEAGQGIPYEQVRVEIDRLLQKN